MKKKHINLHTKNSKYRKTTKQTRKPSYQTDRNRISKYLTKFNQNILVLKRISFLPINIIVKIIE